jgi:hypothetical protein
MQGLRAAALVVGLLWILMGEPVRAQLTFSEAVARRRPHPEEIELERFLAAGQRAAAGARGLAAEGPTTSVEAGPRDVPEGRDTDLALGIELPLLAARSERQALAEMLPDAAGAMRAAARTVADAELAEAFIAAWLAQAIAELRQQDMAAVDSWLAAARRRAEAGADPPYEPTLVSGERDRAIVELIEARREVELTWGGLKALSDVPLRPEPLDPAGLPGKERPEGTPPPAAAADVRAGLEARRRLSEALARAAAASSSSRWALAGTVAREGDERLAHLGVAYRLPLRGERSAIAAEQAAAEAQGSRDAELRLTAIEARLAAAEGTLASTGPMLDSADLDRAQAALAVRVEEGKERPSEVLPLRRQLLEARVAALRARAARLAAEAQLHLLGGEGQ